jgi:hypothetical protein
MRLIASRNFCPNSCNEFHGVDGDRLGALSPRPPWRGRWPPQVLRINPGFTIEGWKRLMVYKDPKDGEHRIDGLRKTGLPES